MKKLLPFFKGFGKECVLSPLFKMLEASFELMIPLVVALIVDEGVAQGDTNQIVRLCLIMTALGLVGLGASVAGQYFAAKAAVGVSARLRQGLMAHILGFSYSQIDGIGTSTLITRMTSDVNQVQTGVNLALRLLLRSPFVVFGAMIMAFSIDFHAALTFAVMIPVLCVVVFGIMLITMPMYKFVQKRLDAVTSATRQNLTGVRVLRAFCKEEGEIAHFEKQTEWLTEGQIKAGRISALMNPVTFVIVNLSIVALINQGALKVESGILTQGMVIALYNYMSQILVELIKMANLIITMTKAGASAGRILSVIDIPQEDTDGNSGLIPQDFGIEFKDVTARYDGAGAPSLEHISFRVEEGQTLGIIGGTGSGKTTLINLIPKFYDTAAGEVCIGGVNVKDMDQELLRASVGIVPQKAILFKGSIRGNLLWGNENASDDDLMDAIRIAQAEDVIHSRQEGLDAEVEQGGTNFSGGQRQRLTIARALVRKPRILILDDSASALDYATDAKLRSAIRNMPSAPTTIIVSQRAASVRHADKIVVLDDGEMVGFGTHEELLSGCEVYQQIYYSQFPKEVADHES